jgi:hypothetical protein
LNNPKENGKSTIPVGCMGAHSHYGLLGQGPASWPMVVAFGWPTPSVHGQRVPSVRSPSRAQLAHAAWRAHRRFARAQATTRFSPSPSSWIQLQATTPKPRRGGRKEGSHHARRLERWQPMVSRVETEFRPEKVLLAQLPSCTQTLRALGKA